MNSKNWFQGIGIHTRIYCLVLFVSGWVVLRTLAA